MESQRPPLQGNESFLRSVLGSIVASFLRSNPAAKTVYDFIQSANDGRISFDHLAFRTFAIDGYGIDSLVSFFTDYGYTLGDELDFPSKKVRARWYAPPVVPVPAGGSDVNGPLPRVFISELLVDQLSLQTQEIIRKYLKASGNGYKHAIVSCALGSSIWTKPTSTEFKQLSGDSEYAAYMLFHGYGLNHVALSVHQMKPHINSIERLRQVLEENGFNMSTDGGVVKVSPDGMLLQNGTEPEKFSFRFADGGTELVTGGFAEFVERLVLPQYKDLPEAEIKEYHRREGFEVGNALKLMVTTYGSRKAAELHEIAET